MPDESTLLEALLLQGVDYPHGCTSGLCGMCKSRLVSGSVDLLDHFESALSGAERDAGMILACRTVARSDCVIAPVPLGSADMPAPVSLACRVTEICGLTHDIKRVSLSVDDDLPFQFLAGQYASLRFADLPPRDFSMANVPGAPCLDFYIRRNASGRVTRHIFEDLQPGAAVTVDGPYGVAFLREEHAGPILAVAGGSGLAPIKSIIETALRRGMRQPIQLYFGVRSECDVYMEAELRDLAVRHANFSHQIMLSANSDSTPKRTGFLHDALANDFSGRSLTGTKVYMAGPPAMVESTSRVMEALGIGPEDRHADPFFTEAEKQHGRAQDDAARHRTG